jgi:hypothetical protein
LDFLEEFVFGRWNCAINCALGLVHMRIADLTSLSIGLYRRVFQAMTTFF